MYRLEKIKKLTGLDLREFDDAITFKVALMVKKYLVSRGIESKAENHPVVLLRSGRKGRVAGEFNSSGNRALPAMCSVHFPGCGKTACRGPLQCVPCRRYSGIPLDRLQQTKEGYFDSTD